jgi:hypothetical protein
MSDTSPLPAERRDISRSFVILEPYDNLLAERARDPFQRRQARQVLPAFQPADGRHARPHSLGQLPLGEAVSTPAGEDHSSQCFVGGESHLFGAVLGTPRGTPTSGTTASASASDRAYPALLVGHAGQVTTFENRTYYPAQ